MQPIVASKVILREGRDADIQPLFRYITDPQVARYLVVLPPSDMQMFGERLREMFTTRDVEHNYIIARRDTGEAVGMVRLHLESSTTGNISYWMGKPHWSKGYAIEAVGILCTMGFVDWGLETLEAHCFGGNVRSITLLDRLGFRSMHATQISSRDPMLGQELLFRLKLADFTWKPRDPSTRSG
ncbi:MAG: GNAT family N-acetyltransferase [Candidatus Eremiobacteraeota bacterium]|nr:GNAT family N-acetyltransferase [Candidatus Eremiobacteraeota bacterium]